MTKQLWMVALWMGIATAVVTAQTQAELTQQAAKEFKAADAQLNQVYKQILAHVPADQKDKLASAQLAWIKFRDADAVARAYRFKGGTIEPMAEYNYETETTRHRMDELKQFLLELTQEGDRPTPFRTAL